MSRRIAEFGNQDTIRSPLSFARAINAALAGLAIGFLLASSRKAECVITVLFARPQANQ